MVEKRGRKTKYDEKFNDIAYQSCKMNGYTNEQLAELFEVSGRTIDEWISTHEEFAKKVRAGKDVFDTEIVETKLLQRATGYKYIETSLDKDGNEKSVERELPPDTQSMFFWLKNRNPARWRDVRNVQLDMGKELVRNVFVVPDVAEFDNAVIIIREEIEIDYGLQNTTADKIPE
jgi:hypothetical protein